MTGGSRPENHGYRGDHSSCFSETMEALVVVKHHSTTMALLALILQVTYRGPILGSYPQKILSPDHP